MIPSNLLILLAFLALGESFSPRAALIIRPSRAVRATRLFASTPVAGDLATDSHRAPSAADPLNIRNVALVGHSHSGKTALAEWLLFEEKVLTKEPVKGASYSLDADPVEAHRQSSVFSHFARVPHRNQYLLEVSDTPWGDFPSNAVAALDGADAAVIVVSAPDSVQSGTIHAYQHCQAAGIKTMVALSKMDRPFVRLDQVLDDIESQLGMKPTPLQVPIGQGEGFEGVQSLFVLGEEGALERNPAAGLEEAWTALEEAVAVTDDDLLVDYLDQGRLREDQVFGGLRSGVLQGKILPLVYTSAEKDAGIVELADAIVGVLPNPLEMREAALQAACESDEGKCGLKPGVEAGFAARVLHTIVDSFGSLSVLRVISNSCDKDGSFQSLPNEAVNLRTGDKFKVPSASAAFGLCGKERLPLADGAHIVPGDVVAIPKLPDTVRTNDIVTVPSAVLEEESEIAIEASTNVLTPLSRPTEAVPLMASATISMAEAGNKKSKRNNKSSAGDDKLNNALAALAREDTAINVEHDSNSGMLMLHCMSGDHLQLVALRLKDRYGLDVELGRPPVPYRETLVKRVSHMEGKHKKQSGGSGQFGVCYIDMEPLEEGQGIEFESKIKGGAISKPFISSVEKGVMEQLESGGPIGYPVTDVKVTLVDGKMHSVDSKDIAFQSAGKAAVRAALEKGKTRLLQPMDKVTFIVDEKMQGEINTIVSRKDGYVTSTELGENGDLQVEAILPGAAIAEVSDVLRAASAGEGQFTSEFSHYQPLPDNLVDDIVGRDNLMP